MDYGDEQGTLEESEEIPQSERPTTQHAPVHGVERAPRHHTEENVVFVSKKGVMAYVLAVITQFNGGTNVVTIKARGKVISRAVDTAEIVRNKFLHDVTIKSITTSTEDMVSASGSPTKVSTIEIVMARTSESKELRL